MKNIVRFRILLPMFLLVISIILDKTGDSQMNRLVRSNVEKYGFMEHPLPEQYAIARYMDYGLNAPAWLLSVKMPFIFPRQINFSCCGFISSEKDWEYLAFVVAMWCLIGSLLDRRRAYHDADKPASSVWLSRVTRGLCGFYGGLLCYSVVEFYQAPWNYPLWFLAPVAFWGAALILGSVFPLSPTRMKVWYRVLGVFTVVAGMFYLEAAIQLYNFRSSFGISTITMVSIWGSAAILGGLYLFKLSGRPPRPV